MDELKSDLRLHVARVSESIGALLLEVVRGLVSRPERAVLHHGEVGDTVVITLTVAADDFSVVNGREGRTARSLRTIGRCIAQQAQILFELYIQQEERNASS
jgi:predicted RNA-binding protein YlqC (UPF0109 family)